MIRHAPQAAAFPVGPLPVAVIEPSLPALLVSPVGGPPAKPLTQQLFAGPHRRPSGGTGQPRLGMASVILSKRMFGRFFGSAQKTPIVG